MRRKCSRQDKLGTNLPPTYDSYGFQRQSVNIGKRDVQTIGYYEMAFKDQ